MASTDLCTEALLDCCLTNQISGPTIIIVSPASTLKRHIWLPVTLIVFSWSKLSESRYFVQSVTVNKVTSLGITIIYGRCLCPSSVKLSPLFSSGCLQCKVHCLSGQPNQQRSPHLLANGTTNILYFSMHTQILTNFTLIYRLTNLHLNPFDIHEHAFVSKSSFPFFHTAFFPAYEKSPTILGRLMQWTGGPPAWTV